MSAPNWLDIAGDLKREQSTSDNPWIGVAEKIRNETRSLVTANQARPLDIDPKAHLLALDLAETTGIRPDTVRRNLREAQYIERLRRFPFDRVDGSPSLQRFFSGEIGKFVEPGAVIQFHDALMGRGREVLQQPSLGQIIASRFQESVVGAFQLPDIAFPLIMDAIGVSQATLAEHAAFREHMARPAPLNRPGAFDDIISALPEQLPNLALIVGAGVVGAGVGAGEGAILGAIAGSIAPGAGTAAGALAGAGTGAAIGAKTAASIAVFKLEAAHAFVEFQGLTDEDGNPLTPEEIAWGAILVGALNAMLEIGGFIAIARLFPGIRNLPGIGRRAIQRQIASRLSKPATRKAVIQTAREALRATGVEVATEVGQETSNIEVGRFISDKSLGFNQEDLLRLGQVAGLTIFAAGPITAMGSTISTVLNNASVARQNVARIKLARQAIEEGKLHEMGPAAFRRLTAELAKEGGIENVSIPAEELLKLYQQDESDVTALFDDLPEARDQMDEALEAGGDIVIPVESLFDKLDQRFGEQLDEHVRLRAEDDTLAEANVRLDELDDRIEEEVKTEAKLRTKEGALQDSAEQVYRNVLAQLVEAGTAPAVAEKFALLTRHRYRTRGERLGQDPFDLFKRENLRIIGPSAKVGERIVLRPELQATLAEIRADLEPELKRLPKQPVLSLLKKRGGVDPTSPLAGELQAIGVQRKGVGSVPGLFRKGGIKDLDSLADLTDEPIFAGFQPIEEGGTRLDPQDLLNAIQEELQGRPLRTEAQQAKIQKAQRERLELGEAITAAGLDITTATDEEIAQALLRDMKLTTLEQAVVSQERMDQIIKLVQASEEFFDVPIDKARVRRALNAAPDLSGDRFVAAVRIAGRLKLDTTGTQDHSALLGRKATGGPNEGFVDKLTGEFLNRGELEVVFNLGIDLGVDVSQQKGKGRIRGQLTTNRDLTQIAMRLFAAQNLSTFLHESGHLYLLQLFQDAQTQGAGQLQEDVDAVLQWLGLTSIDQVTTVHHDRWAKAFEAYLRNGRAPSVELRGVFARFQIWLQRIYESVKELGGTPPAQISEVMDRLLATEGEIAQAQQMMSMEALDLRGDGLLTGAEADQFDRVVQRGREVAQEELNREIMREITAQRTQQRREDRERIRQVVEAEVNSSPVFRAKHWLQTGEFLDGDTPEGLEHVRLDRKTLVDHFGGLSGLPFGNFGVWQSNGIHPNDVAERFGFRSGQALVRALRESDSRTDTIKRITDQRMTEEFGDFASDGSMEEAALAAVHNEESIRGLLIEERALAKRIGAPLTPKRLARLAAVRIIAARKVSQITPHRYRQAGERAARAASEAFGKKDYAEARTQKRRQIINVMLEMEARKALKQTDRAVERIRRMNTKAVQRILGLAGETYQEEMNALLSRFEFRAGVSVARTRTLREWVIQKEAENEDVVISEKLREEAFATHHRNLSVEDLLALEDAVLNIEHLARKKVGMIVEDRRLAHEEIEADIVTEAEEAFPGRERHVRLNQSTLRDGLDLALGLDASLTRVEFAIDVLSGNKPDSALRRIIWEPLVRAAQTYRIRLDEMAQRIDKRMEALGDGAVKAYREILSEDRLTTRKGQVLELSKWNVIVIALNMGNASNRFKLLEGYGWDPDTVQAVFRTHMKREDWEFVQGVWDDIGTLWPEIAAMEKRLTGVVPPKIEATEVVTPFGTFRGGYFPVAYDFKQSQIGQRNKIVDLVPGMSEGYTRAITGHGHTKARTEAFAPIRLDISVLSNHLDQVILDLTHREAIQNAGRILGRQGVDDAIQDKLGEKFSYQNFWVPWLQALARDTVDPGPLAAAAKIARSFRLSATVFKLGFRETTLLVQAAGHFNALRILKEHLPEGANHRSFWLRGVMLSMGHGNPMQALRTFRMVRELSIFMRQRTTTMDRDLRDVIRAAERSGAIIPKVAAFSLELIARVQMITVDLPVWLAGYTAAVETMGMNQERAVLFADSMARKSQGGGNKADQAAFQRGGRGGSEFVKLATLFYSYNNVVYNQLRASGRKVQSVRDVPAFLASYLMYAIMPALYSWIMYATLKGRWPDQDDDDFDKQVRDEGIRILFGDAAQTIPVARDFFPVLIGRPINPASALAVFGREVRDLASFTDGMDLMFDFMRIGTLVRGLPGDRPLRFAEDILRGEEE